MTKDRDQRPGTKDAEAWRFTLPEAAATDACPSENELTGYIEKTLLPGESERIETHLETCTDCLEIVGAAAEATVASDAQEPAIAERRRRRHVLVAAALIALGGVVGLVVHRLLSTNSGPSIDPAPSWYATLRDAARAVATKAPDLLADLVPYAPEELAALGSGPTRSSDSLELLSPREIVLDRRPDIRMQLPSGAEDLRILLEDAAGSKVFDVRPSAADLVLSPASNDGIPESATLAYPAAAAALESGGSYVVTIMLSTPLGKSEASAAFRLATPEATDAWRRAAAALEASGNGSIAVLLRGHLALRRGYLDEAEKAAREVLGVDPGDPGARELRHGVRRRRR